MRQKRHAPRVRARGLAVHVSTAGKRLPCVAENISIGGLFVRTDEELPVGTDVRLDVVRPGWKKVLTLGARVVSRIDPSTAQVKRMRPGIGMQFFSLVADQRTRLQGLLEELGIDKAALERVQEPFEVTEPPPVVPPPARAAPAQPLRVQGRAARREPPLMVPVRPPGPEAQQGLESRIAGLEQRLDEAQEQIRLKNEEIAELHMELEAVHALLNARHQTSTRPPRK